MTNDEAKAEAEWEELSLVQIAELLGPVQILVTLGPMLLTQHVKVLNTAENAETSAQAYPTQRKR